MNSNFANNLKKIRKEKHLSQEELADKLGVSRQSVSKWESSLAYPEMDKVLQLCKLFNLNIDELLNQDINEVKETKEVKSKLNSYVDEFLSFITKTTDMFTSLTFSGKLKCLFEQVIIIFSLYIICNIISYFGENIFHSIFGLLSTSSYNMIFNIFKSLYYVIYTIIAFIAYIHVFKTRYLDYYEIVKNDEKEENKRDVKNDEPRNKKIIIRSTNHKLLDVMFKIVIFCIKCFLFLIFISASCFLIGIISLLFICISNLFVNVIFLGATLGLLGASIINILVLLLIFNFIFERKTHYKMMFICLIISLSLIGVGIPVFVMNVIDLHENKVEYQPNDEITNTFDYQKDMIIYNESDNYVFMTDNTLKDKVKIVVEYNDELNNIKIVKDKYDIRISVDTLYKFKDIYHQVKKDLKNNQIRNYEYKSPEVIIYSSKNNIEHINVIHDR